MLTRPARAARSLPLALAPLALWALASRAPADEPRTFALVLAPALAAGQRVRVTEERKSCRRLVIPEGLGMKSRSVEVERALDLEDEVLALDARGGPGRERLTFARAHLVEEGATDDTLAGRVALLDRSPRGPLEGRLEPREGRADEGRADEGRADEGRADKGRTDEPPGPGPRALELIHELELRSPLEPGLEALAPKRRVALAESWELDAARALSLLDDPGLTLTLAPGGSTAHARLAAAEERAGRLTGRIEVTVEARLEELGPQLGKLERGGTRVVHATLEGPLDGSAGERRLTVTGTLDAVSRLEEAPGRPAIELRARHDLVRVWAPPGPAAEKR